MRNRIKVLFITNLPSPYMIGYLNELSNYCDITALFELVRASDRDEEWFSEEKYKFHFVRLKSIKIGSEAGLSVQQIYYIFSKRYDRIIICDPTTPTGIVSLLLCRWFNKGFLIQSEGGFQGSGKGIKEKFKKYIMESAEGYLSGMSGETDYFLMYGAKQNNLYWYPFTSLYMNEIDKQLITEKEKRKLRNELEIDNNKTIVISVGRILPVKGFDLIIKCSNMYKNQIVFYIVGGQPTDEYRSLMTSLGVENIRFIPFVDKKDLKKYYHASDVFLLPTRGDTWGLVINEAMANGLPVITTDRCIAGLQLIENETNGYIFHTDNMDEMTEALNSICFDSEKRRKIGMNNLKKIKDYSLENMGKVVARSLYMLEGSKYETKRR